MSQTSLIKVSILQWCWSVGYSIGQITLGLLVHPYQTMQSLVQDKVFIWMTLLPTGLLAVVTAIWRFAVVPSVRVIFSCQATGFGGCDWLPLVSNWITFFCVYWQVILLYLLVRFSKVFRYAS